MHCIDSYSSLPSLDDMCYSTGSRLVMLCHRSACLALELETHQFQHSLYSFVISYSLKRSAICMLWKLEYEYEYSLNMNSINLSESCRMSQGAQNSFTLSEMYFSDISHVILFKFSDVACHDVHLSAPSLYWYCTTLSWVMAPEWVKTGKFHFVRFDSCKGHNSGQSRVIAIKRMRRQVDITTRYIWKFEKDPFENHPRGANASFLTIFCDPERPIVFCISSRFYFLCCLKMFVLVIF